MGEAHNGAAWLVDRHVDDGRGQRIAVRCEGVDTTYADLQQEMFRVQNALAVLGLVRGDRVALVLNDDLMFPAWFLGAQRSGVVPVPLSTMLGGAELGPIIADSGAAVVVVSEVYADAVNEMTAGAPAMTEVVMGGFGAVASAGPQVTIRNWVV